MYGDGLFLILIISCNGLCFNYGIVLVTDF
jgi:hypothetical protein